MLHKYRKTALIEAEQFDGSIKQITRYKVHIVGPTSRGDTSCFLLPTKEGNMKLNAGDYIATGIDGEHWVIDKDVFKRTYERMNKMKAKLLLVPVIAMMGLMVSAPLPASADTTDPTRVEIEAQGNQKINALWSQYQQALQEREDAWEQGQGNRFSPAYMTADAKAGATYQEWLQAQTRLGDDLHNYDVAQWQREQDQPSNQTPVDDSQVPEENSQALNTQGSQATVPTSQSATPASQAKLSSQPATQELTQQASVADPASQPITQSTAQKPQQASVSVQADKTGNLPAQNKKPVQERTEQSSVATLPQTGNQAGLGAISIGIASALAMFGLAGVKRD